MKSIISEANGLLENSQFDWAVCGGLAIDLFVGRNTRPHQDLDLAVFWEHRDSIIGFMLIAKWRVFEACGGGRIQELVDVSNSTNSGRNIFCFPRSSTRCQLAHVEGDVYQFTLESRAQRDLDYVEFLFNERDTDCLYYARNKSIRRSMNKAIISVDGIPVLAPEVVLLYKSTFYNYLNATDAAQSIGSEATGMISRYHCRQ